MGCESRIWCGELALSGFVRFVARKDAGIGVSTVMRPYVAANRSVFIRSSTPRMLITRRKL